MRGLSIELQATSELRGHEVGACRSPPFAPLTPRLPHMQSTLFYHCLCKVMFWIFLISSVYNSFQIALGLGQYFCHYKLLSRWVNDGLHHRVPAFLVTMSLSHHVLFTLQKGIELPRSTSVAVLSSILCLSAPSIVAPAPHVIYSYKNRNSFPPFWSTRTCMQNPT